MRLEACAPRRHHRHLHRHHLRHCIRRLPLCLLRRRLLFPILSFIFIVILIIAAAIVIAMNIITSAIVIAINIITSALGLDCSWENVDQRHAPVCQWGVWGRGCPEPKCGVGTLPGALVRGSREEPPLPRTL